MIGLADGGVVKAPAPPAQNYDVGGPVINQNWGFAPASPNMASTYIAGGANSLQNGISNLVKSIGSYATGNGGSPDQTDDEAETRLPRCGFRSSEIAGVDIKEVQAPAF